MTQPIKLHQLLLCSTVAVSLAGATGCPLVPAKLDGGGESATVGDETSDESGTDGELAAECLSGTELDAVGLELSSWSPPCPVVCGSGWGHDAASLSIAWTVTTYTQQQADALRPRGLELLPSGDVLVAASAAGDLVLTAIDLDGQTLWTSSPDNFKGEIDGLATNNEGIYAIHSLHEGQVAGTFLSAFELDGSHRWTFDLPGDAVHGVAAAAAGVAVLVGDSEQDTRDLMLLDADAIPVWTVAVDLGLRVEFSPSGDSLGIAEAGALSVYDSVDGNQRGMFAPTEGNASLGSSGLAFIDDDTVVSVGAILGGDDDMGGRFDGWVEYRGFDASDWSQRYNRADSWCPDPEDDEFSADTAEFFNDVVVLADDTLIVVAGENYDGQGIVGAHPWVGQFSAGGQFLAGARGLWNGFAMAAVAGADGSALVLSTDNGNDEGDQGWVLRKYMP